MASVSDEKHSASVYLKTLLPKVVWIGGLAAVFLILASSHVISSLSGGTTVDNYVYGIINRLADKSDLNKSSHSGQQGFGYGSVEKMGEGIAPVAQIQRERNSTLLASPYSTSNYAIPSPPLSTDSSWNSSVDSGTTFGPVQEPDELVGRSPANSDPPVAPSPYSSSNTSRPLPTNSRRDGSVYSECDLYHGRWVYDSRGPLYKNDSCPVLTQKQNCQGNGRPDKEYENWRWKPNDCDIPRFNARKFLDLMRGKTLAFIGDSLARNQMKSLICILWQVEVPTSTRSKKMQRYDFASTSTTIIRIWSAWLVNTTTAKFDFAPDGIDKLQLDVPDEAFMELIPQFDVIVLSSGHWFSKKSAYILNNEVVGGRLWWPKKSRKMKVDNTKALAISVETVLSAMVTHPNYKGLTVVRTYSPAHYEGGSWNTGGSCTGKVRPLKSGEVVKNKLTTRMYDQQVRAFNRSIKKITNKSKLKLMDITEAFGYRHDGHPGPYRSPDPKKITEPGPDGKPPPQDCGHWCMPGPVDTWNEILSEILRRGNRGRYVVSS